MKKFITFCCVTCLAFVLTFTTSCKKASDAVIELDVNPKVSLTVSSKGKVTSAEGLNDDGKMVLADEEIVGKDYEDAIKIIIDIETKCGFFVKGDVSADENNLTITVETNGDKVAKKMAENAKVAVEKKCKELNVQISGKIELVKSSAHEDLVERATSMDPNLDKKAAEEMTNEQLVKYIAAYQLEVATLPTKEIEELYNNVKAYQFSAAKSEAVANAIDNANNAYISTIGAAYKSACEVIKSAQDSLNEAFYDGFVDENSEYQQLYKEVLNRKAEMLKAREDLAQADDANKAQKEAYYDLAVAALNSATASLDTGKASAYVAVTSAQAALQAAQTTVDSIYASLPQDIKTFLTNSASDIDAAMNNAKDTAFAKFEEEYKDDIENAYNNAKAYKQQLIDALREN